MNNNQQGFISRFAEHRVAANLLMALMMLSGLWALTKINVQFLPTFYIQAATVSIVWPGASAEDIEKSITNPVERELRNIDSLKDMFSTSTTGSVTMRLEFEQSADMGQALENIRERVSRVRNLPQASEKPVISRVIPYEAISKILITGPKNLDEIRPLIHRFERELLDRGIARVDVLGLPDLEIAIQIATGRLAELKLSLPQIANIINARSRDFPAGTIGKQQVGRRLRSLEQRRTISAFENLPIINDNQGQIIRLKDIAQINLRPQEAETQILYKGQPSVEMRLLRSEDANALKSAKIINQWLEQTRTELGESVQIIKFDERWSLIKERIDLLVKNGGTGLILILLLLFLVLERHVAVWVSAGIPASFLAAVCVLYLYGGSINMVSLFAFIMTLGIVVDDTIVVGEQTLTNIQGGMPILSAAKDAAYKMLAPIMSSSLTTISAFLPLLLIGDVIGKILIAIPIVVICMIIASLIECFLVLPGHLAHSLNNYTTPRTQGVRYKVNEAFKQFRDKPFKRFVKKALLFRAMTLSICFSVFLLTIGLLAGGFVNFTFFPSPEGKRLITNIQFVAGTPPETVKQFVGHLENTLYQTAATLEKQYGQPLLEIATATLNRSELTNYQKSRGEQFASMFVELTSTDAREVTNNQFIQAWKSDITLPPAVENFSIFAPRGGPPGEDIDIEFSGDNTQSLKAAATRLKAILARIPGVSDINDDLPFGQDQLVFSVNTVGKSVGLTIDSVGAQLRAAFTGQIAQIYHEPNEEIEVRVILPDSERNDINTLEYYPVITPAGEHVPLGTVVDLRYLKSPDTLLHTDTKLTVHIRAKVDNEVNNNNQILTNLTQTAIPEILARHNLHYRLKGRAENQADTLKDMRNGLILSVCLIYIILAWVFGSYGWPIVVMAVIPLGLSGAIVGHLVMGLDITLLSLFGLFGLSGIVINDSIILLNEYRVLREQGLAVRPAIIAASCLRLRAVLLTSLTTIAGLLPLLFETSMQARFLIPMAVSITFGLAFATVMILIVVPTLLSLYEDRRKKWLKPST